MFVMAKLFIALGFRRDLAAIIHQLPKITPRESLQYSEHLYGERHSHP
jgi:hypothetical protein